MPINVFYLTFFLNKIKILNEFFNNKPFNTLMLSPPLQCIVHLEKIVTKEETKSTPYFVNHLN